MAQRKKSRNVDGDTEPIKARQSNTLIMQWGYYFVRKTAQSKDNKPFLFPINGTI
jgi:hypothetical protein